MLYEFRYYKRITIKDSVLIKDDEKLKSALEDVEKKLITAACKLKVITILSNDIAVNYELISNVLGSKTIDLEEISVSLARQDDKTILRVYEENIVAYEREYDYLEDLNVKYGKKIKIFL